MAMYILGLGGSDGSRPTIWETQVRFLSWEDPLEKGRATQPSILDSRNPWTKKPSGLQPMGSESQT